MFIIDPITNNNHNLFTKTGLNILKKFICNFQKGGTTNAAAAAAATTASKASKASKATPPNTATTSYFQYFDSHDQHSHPEIYNVFRGANHTLRRFLINHKIVHVYHHIL